MNIEIPNDLAFRCLKEVKPGSTIEEAVVSILLNRTNVAVLRLWKVESEYDLCNPPMAFDKTILEDVVKGYMLDCGLLDEMPYESYVKEGLISYHLVEVK